MHNDFLKVATDLNAGKKAYATAIIVRRKIPSSGKPGDKAIITADGKIHGWIGGGCTRGIVLKEALLSIQEGKPRLVSISPNAQPNTNSQSKIYTMTCQSGGEVDIYIEPVLPRPHLLVFGISHIAMALAKLAKAMSYTVTCVNHAPDKTVFPDVDTLIHIDSFDHQLDENSYVVVCTQGEGDVDALYAAIQSAPNYLSFVASRKKANSIYKDLRAKGITFDQLKGIKSPAGKDIGAKLPEEVAISILAEIVEDLRAEQTEDNTQSKLEITNDDFYLNPVCNIPIQKSTAKHILKYKEESVYFCCDGCKVSFENAPEKYLPHL